MRSRPSISAECGRRSAAAPLRASRGPIGRGVCRVAWGTPVRMFQMRWRHGSDRDGALAFVRFLHEYSAKREGTTNDSLASNAFLQRMQNRLDRLPPLDLLAAFEAAARHLSFTRASAERFVTQSAMSRQIRALEDDLGVALFRRHHRALSLTESGLRLQATWQTALAQLPAARGGIRTPAP